MSSEERSTEESDFMTGILGLASLVRSFPFTAPEWLPAGITWLARCGHDKAPDLAKKEVQLTLQEFYKTHLDNWEQDIKGKFSERQLEILETYKGVQVYFS
eukprot:Selendium_serpulae@DN4773_c0_g1_i2.p4